MAPQESWSSWLRPVARLSVITGPITFGIGVFDLLEASEDVPHDYTWAWIEIILGVLLMGLAYWILLRGGSRDT